MRRSIPVLVAILVLSWAVTARSLELAGVEVPPTITVEGRTLQLNGAAIRKKLFFKVYVGALYLETPATKPEAILGGERAWLVTMTFLRDVDRAAVKQSYTEGFERNSPGQQAALQAGLDQMTAVLRDVKQGAVMTVRYLPGQGSTISQTGGPTVTVAGQQFADALLRTWLGPVPADADLKRAMLQGKLSRP